MYIIYTQNGNVTKYWGGKMGCASYITNVYCTLKHLLLSHPISNVYTQFQWNFSFENIPNYYPFCQYISFYRSIKLTESMLGRNLLYDTISCHIYLHNMNNWSLFPKLISTVWFWSMNRLFISQHFVISCTNYNFFSPDVSTVFARI